MLCLALVIVAHLVTDYGLLDGSKVLQRRQENVTPLGTTDILGETTELLTQGNKDLILVLDGFYIVGGQI